MIQPPPLNPPASMTNSKESSNSFIDPAGVKLSIFAIALGAFIYTGIELVAMRGAFDKTFLFKASRSLIGAPSFWANKNAKDREDSWMNPRNQSDEAHYYRNFMYLIEQQIEVRGLANSVGYEIDSDDRRTICDTKYTVIEGLKKEGLVVGPHMEAKLAKLTYGFNC